MRRPLFQKIDCIHVEVPSLEAGLAFYRDKLGHELVWRGETSAGPKLPGSDSEIVYNPEPREGNPRLVAQ